MQINDKDAGAHLTAVGGGYLTALAGGTGDNTAATGAIVDATAQSGLMSGAIVVLGEATLAQDETLALNAVMIEHGEDSALSDAAEYTYGGASADNAAVATGGTGGSTEAINFKQNVDLQGVKRYFRVSIKPDLSATGTDTCDLAFGLVLVGESAPLD